MELLKRPCILKEENSEKWMGNITNDLAEVGIDNWKQKTKE